MSEIFYSLQGEGARAGEPSIFVRLQGCSAKHACYASGVVCDTEFESGKEMALDQLFEAMQGVEDAVLGQATDNPRCPWIVWTGGEPLDQLTPEILGWFCHRGFKNAIETSGVKSLSVEMAERINHITVSPKVAEHVLEKNFGHLQINEHFGGTDDRQWNIDELRYVRHAGQPGIPQPKLKAQYQYLSPHSDGLEINQANLEHCVKLCLENPGWRLSVQCHKMWRVL